MASSVAAVLRAAAAPLPFAVHARAHRGAVVQHHQLGRQCVPVVIAGLTADRFGLGRVTAWYFIGLAVLVAVAVAAQVRAQARPATNMEG